MCRAEQPKKQPQVGGDRGSNPLAINQFLIFSLLGSHVLVLFFHLPIFFILYGLVDLI